MRGKKVDTDFLSQFISQCVGKNIFTQDDIVKQAKSEISNIDEQIKKVEKLKVVRSKLLDVVSTFEKKHSSHKEEIKALSFFQMQKPDICQYICRYLKNENISIETLYSGRYPVADIIFCVKQLIEHKIVSKTGDILIRGDAFDEYIDFFLRGV